MRILVTGGAGFIGSHVVVELLGAGHEVVVVDALLPLAHRGGMPEGIDPAVEHLWGDLAEPEVARRAVADVDAVCHQAAMVGLGVDFGDVVDYVHHNDAATASLLHALHERRFRGRFVLAGSMVVYGEGRARCDVHGFVRPGPRADGDLRAGRWEPPCPACGAPVHPESVTEAEPPDPRNVYAATKLHQEHLCGLYGREHDSSVTVFRYHNVYGPGMPRDTPYAGVASIFRSAVEAGEPPLVFEDGGQRRDFVHVRDVARANRLALEADVAYGGVLNVASGEPRTILDLATALCEHAGDRSLVPRVVGRFRTGDVRHIVASTDAIRRELGFRPQVEFRDGIAEFATAALRS